MKRPASVVVDLVLYSVSFFKELLLNHVSLSFAQLNCWLLDFIHSFKLDHLVST